MNKRSYSVRLDPALHTAFKAWAVSSKQTLETAIAEALFKALPPVCRKGVQKP